VTRPYHPGKLVLAVGVILAARLSPERDAEDEPEILLPTDDSELHNVTQPSADDGAPAWSPAGSTVAYGKFIWRSRAKGRHQDIRRKIFPEHLYRDCLYWV